MIQVINGEISKSNISLFIRPMALGSWGGIVLLTDGLKKKRENPWENPYALRNVCIFLAAMQCKPSICYCDICVECLPAQLWHMYSSLLFLLLLSSGLFLTRVKGKKNSSEALLCLFSVYLAGEKCNRCCLKPLYKSVKKGVDQL